MTASQNGSAPAIDARELRAARKRTFTAATRACAVLADAVTADIATLAAGGVPDVSGFRKMSEKYASKLDMLDLQDSLLTPEALEAIYGEHSEPGQVSVARDDLALLTGVIISAGLVPEGAAAGNTPLGRLNTAVNALTPEMAALLTVPGPQSAPSGG
jgi:hypothetical protein